jgi:hypothetical protein
VRCGDVDFGRSTITRPGVTGGKINEDDDEKKTENDMDIVHVQKISIMTPSGS